MLYPFHYKIANETNIHSFAKNKIHGFLKELKYPAR
jgi:hypothetical protein